MAVAEIILDLFDTSNGPGPLTPTSTYVNATPYTKLIAAEHNQQPQFMALVTVFCAAIGDINEAVQEINASFNLNTAGGAQLDVVGQWVGQPRIIPNVLLTGYFGFSDDQAALGFGDLTNPSIGGIWYSLGDSYATTTALNDEPYRLAIKARIVRNQSHGRISDLENALSFVFDANAHIVDTGNYSINIVVDTPVTQVAQALLNGLDLLPRPAGVSIGSITYATGIVVPINRQPFTTITNNWPAVTWRSQSNSIKGRL